MKDFSKNDVRTLKFLNPEKLDFYINFFKTYRHVKKTPIEEVPDGKPERALARIGKSEYVYEYPEIIYDIKDIFEGFCPYNGVLANHDVAQKIEDIAIQAPERLKPNWVREFIVDKYRGDSIYYGWMVPAIEKGAFRKALIQLKKDWLYYQKHPDYYEKKYGAEYLISLEEDCQNGLRSGNQEVLTNDRWEKDWKEFIKHDHQWDFGFFYTLIVHKLQLMYDYFDPDGGHTSSCRRIVKRIRRQIGTALELAKPLDNDGWAREAVKDIADPEERVKARDRLWKQAKRRFFLYLANHYEEWWD